MEIHFYCNVPTDIPYCSCWDDTEYEIKNRKPIIHTTQIGCLSTKLLEIGYRIFVHPTNSSSYEIKLGKNASTTRYICPTHNLFRLWLAGEFSSND